MTLRGWGPRLVLAALYVALVAPLVVLEADRPPLASLAARQQAQGFPSEAKDQDGYHLPVVAAMRAQWPAIDIVRYDAATAPGYHALLAATVELTGGAEDALGAGKPRMLVVNALLGLALLLVVHATAAALLPGARGGWHALALVLPFACSQYVLGGAVWLTTDNAALLFALLALGGAALFAATPARSLRLGLWATLAVAVRQIHVWTAAPIAFAGLLRSPLARFLPAALRDETTQTPRAWRHLVVACLAASLPVALLAVFVALWGGLLPRTAGVVEEAAERIAFHDAGPNPATPAVALSLAAVFGVFFLPGVAGTLRRTTVRPGVVLAVVVAAGLAAALLPRTDYLWRERAYGPLWEVVRRVPAPGGRSLVLLALGPAGALGLLCLYRRAAEAGRGPQALVLLLGLSGWLAAQTMNSMAWQRYFEPMVLAALAWLAALGWPAARDSASPLVRRLMLAGPLLLAAGNLGITLLQMHRPFLAAWRTGWP